MIDDSKALRHSSNSAVNEAVFSLPSPVWRRICQSGKKAKFLEFIFSARSATQRDVETFCESAGIQLSKEERRLWMSVLQGATKYILLEVSQ